MRPQAAEDLLDLQERRLRQLLAVIGAALLAGVASQLAWAEWANSAVLAATLAGIAISWRLAGAGRFASASAVLLVALFAMVATFMWRNGGVRDTTLLSFPCILVLGSLLADRRGLYLLLAGMIGLLSLLAWSNLGGWHVNYIDPVSVETVTSMVIILGATCAVVGLVNDDLRALVSRLREEIGQARAHRDRVQFLAHHDALTGLANRGFARERFQDMAANARRNSSSVALLYLDLDNFKTTNDTYGHPTGDRLLQAVSHRLTETVRASDVVCRLGGDEFLLLLDEQPDADTVGAIARKVLENLGATMRVDDLELSTDASVGIALYPADGLDFDVLVQRADVAMYKAKDTGRQGFRFFDAEINAEVQAHTELASSIRTAISASAFTLHFQPQIELASGRLLGAEALLRWHHASLGWISPARFIPIAEHYGLITGLGDWVLREACSCAARWRAEGLGDLVVGVNVSPAQFRRGNLCTTVADALRATGLPAELLELELTESVLLHDSLDIVRSLAELRLMGVRLAIDDFGTGYSNLSYLRQFDVHRLKIDQSFVRRVATEPDDEIIVRAIIQMAQALGLSTLAEGVEDETTCRRLSALGCSTGQGFWWSKALPDREFVAFASARRGALKQSA